MRRIYLAIFFWLIVPALAWAGPWARDPADVFLSYSLNTNSTRDGIASGGLDGTAFHSIYGEIGLGHRLTFGLDLGSSDTTRLGSAFLRYTFTPNAATWQFAADLGLGARSFEGADSTTLYRVGVSVGRGFQQRHLDWVPVLQPRDGWFQIDSSVLIDPDGTQTIWQSEATFGAFVNDRFGGMFQLKAEEFPDNAFTLSASPSLLMRFGQGTTAQLGTSFGLVGSDEIGVRLALWQDF